MNYGPLEFADYLRRNSQRDEPATVKAARAAAPGRARLDGLKVVSARRTTPGPATVFEVMAAITADSPETFEVIVRPEPPPLVLVLSSQNRLRWRLTRLPGAALELVLLAGRGGSTVMGAENVPVIGIGGFHAFQRGSAGFRHLESQVRLYTGRAIGRFRGFQVGASADLGDF